MSKLNFKIDMKKQFTKTLCTAVVTTALLTSLSASAQQTNPTPADTANKAEFRPSGRLWGYAFGDVYYKAHSDSLNRGGSNQYTNVAKNRNAFQLRRVYLGYDYDISKKFSAELLLAAEDNVTTSAGTGTASATTSGDLLTDNKISFYIKLINLRWKNIFNGSDLVIGQVSTPAFALLSEKVWGYRSIERTVADIRRTPSFDLGLALQGTFDPATKNYGYDLMVGNGQSAKPENDAFKWFYADVYAKFLDQKLIFDLYADYEGFAYSNQVSSTLTIPDQSRSMIKGFVAYTTPQFTVGVEAFTNTNKGGALTTTQDAAKTRSYVDVKSLAVSAYVRGMIIKNQLGFFARYDNYNPNNDYNTALTYSSPLVSQYDSNTKEQFVTAGLDFTPAKNVHIMPNVWYNKYTAQQANVTGNAQSDYDLVYRLTAFFTFGK
jgi:hypothetical protein